MSGIIFVALALGWAVYLIPKALQRNEELAKTRSVVSFSGRMRVFGSGRKPAEVATSTLPSSSLASSAGTPASASSRPVSARPLITRAAAQRAAKRRRIVLALLVLALATVSALAWFAIAPTWAPAVPGGLILVFLMIARISVRRQSRARVPVAAQAFADLSDEDTAAIDVSALAAASPSGGSASPSALAGTTPVGTAHGASAPVVSAEPLPDDGSLWDPLPVTLPTYVTKPTARRTVRTIELTASPATSSGQFTSSGHSAVDSELVKQVEAAQQAQKQAEKQAEAAEERATGSGDGQRKAAGA